MPFLKPYKEPRSRILERTTRKNGLRHAIFNIKGDKYIGEWKNNVRHDQVKHVKKMKQYQNGNELIKFNKYVHERSAQKKRKPYHCTIQVKCRTCTHQR
ncbi:MORN repeat-containing protein 3, variant 2 [Homalodisca vitripennis]|nr:MORN repeat-containing protein 3, variant 2 [Homalodisca vitripennis]